MTTWVCWGLGSFELRTRSSWPLIPRWTTRVDPLSRLTSRYLPRRPTPLMERPSSRARKCLALGWRRTERPLATETSFPFRPTTSLARSWRRVSTSGSSGIAQPPPRVGRRGLLGILLGGPLARAALVPGHEHLSPVAAAVVGPRAPDPPFWGPARAALVPGHEHLSPVAAAVVGPRALDLVLGHPFAAAHGGLLESALVV